MKTKLEEAVEQFAGVIAQKKEIAARHTVPTIEWRQAEAAADLLALEAAQKMAAHASDFITTHEETVHDLKKKLKEAEQYGALLTDYRKQLALAVGATDSTPWNLLIAASKRSADSLAETTTRALQAEETIVELGKELELLRSASQYERRAALEELKKEIDALPGTPAWAEFYGKVEQAIAFYNHGQQPVLDRIKRLEGDNERLRKTLVAKKGIPEGGQHWICFNDKGEIVYSGSTTGKYVIVPYHEHMAATFGLENERANAKFEIEDLTKKFAAASANEEEQAQRVHDLKKELAKRPEVHFLEGDLSKRTAAELARFTCPVAVDPSELAKLFAARYEFFHTSPTIEDYRRIVTELLDFLDNGTATQRLGRKLAADAKDLLAQAWRALLVAQGRTVPEEDMPPGMTNRTAQVVNEPVRTMVAPMPPSHYARNMAGDDSGTESRSDPPPSWNDVAAELREEHLHSLTRLGFITRRGLARMIEDAQGSVGGPARAALEALHAELVRGEFMRGEPGT